MAGDAIDIGMSTLDELVTKDTGLRNIGRQVEYILPAWQFLGLGFFVNVKAGVRPLDDFKKNYKFKVAANKFLDQLIGKKVAYPQGSLFEQAFYKFVENADRKISEFTIINTEAEAGLNGLEDKDVAMASVGSQQFAEAKRRGYKTAIIPRDLGLVVITGFMAKKYYRERNEDIIIKFICGWYETVRWVANNPKKTYEILNQYMTERGSTSISFQEYMDLRELNQIALSPAEAEKLFLREESLAYWKITWNKTIENMTKNMKEEFVPKDTNSFIAPLMIDKADKTCTNNKLMNR
jgi:hypothetical protein